MRLFPFAAAAVALSLLGAVAAGQGAPAQHVRANVAKPAVSLRFDGGVFTVAGWAARGNAPAAGWASLFAVYSGPPGAPPMLGSYGVQNGVLSFRPAFPIAAGVSYRAVFKAPGQAPVETSFAGPALKLTPVAHVVQIYPSGDVLPSNQLRLYIYFSRPMSRGEAARYIHVLDDAGKHLEGPRGIFLPGEELWDPNFDRLTLTFDPGRIKRGLTSNMAAGPPIVEGRRYTLLVDRDWPDAGGAPMVEGFSKTFRGGPAERRPPDPKDWRIDAPKAGTAKALVIRFPNPMNFPLLQRMIAVSGAHGAVAGTVSVSGHETEWRFTPNDPWAAGDYHLVVDTGLEDLAGNHIGQPFDIDTFQRVTAHIATTTVHIPVAIR